MIDIEFIREYCLSFPGAKEQIQWETSLLFKVNGKMFAIYSLYDEGINRISIKCDPEKYEQMLEIDCIIPAPYLARNKWITIQDGCRLTARELKKLIRESYELIFAKLPKKEQKKIKDL